MNNDDLNQARIRLLAAGVNQADLAWFESLGWSDAQTPPVRSQADLADFQRREAVLSASVAHLSFAERAIAPEGKLAAAIGAQIADWNDRDDDE